MSKTYTAVYEREGDAWLVEIAEEPRVHSWGRTLAKAREHIRDALALWLEADPNKLDIVDDFRLPAAARESLQAARASRGTAERAAREPKEAAARAARGTNRHGPVNAGCSPSAGCFSSAG